MQVGDRTHNIKTKNQNFINWTKEVFDGPVDVVFDF